MGRTITTAAELERAGDIGRFELPVAEILA
jgi:hypothetical protein